MGFTPVWGNSVHTLEGATQRILKLLYGDETLPPTPISNKIPQKTARNEAIRRRYAAGESVPELARAFRVSQQRVHQILRGRQH